MTSRLASRQLTLNEINTSTESAVLNSGIQPLARARASGLSSDCKRLGRSEEWDPKISDAHYNEPRSSLNVSARRPHQAEPQVFTFGKRRRLTDLRKKKVRGEASGLLC